MTVIRKCNGKAYKETTLKQSLWEKKREEIKKEREWERQTVAAMKLPIILYR